MHRDKSINYLSALNSNQRDGILSFPTEADADEIKNPNHCSPSRRGVALPGDAFFVCPECFLRRWTERSPDALPAGSQHEIKGVAGNGKV